MKTPSQPLLGLILCLTPNLEEGYVLVNVLGLNPSLLNGFKLDRNINYAALHGDILELVPGKYKYVFEFVYETTARAVGNPSAPHTSKQRSEGRIGGSNDNSDSTITPTAEGWWETPPFKGLHIYTSAGVVASKKVAAYDMNGTLIKSNYDVLFPESFDDWQIAFPEVPGKLKKLHACGYKLVIFTNQAAIGKYEMEIFEFRRKIEAVVRKLGVPMQVFISTGPEKYRKPRTGMWDALCERQMQQTGVAINPARCFYVGDAAGRPNLKKPFNHKKDHSCADRLLAMNIGIRFLTPEQHFQNLPKQPWIKPKFNPRKVCRLTANGPLLTPPGALLAEPRQEVIVMVGFPGSGKSHFVWNHLAPKGYDVVNRDTLGSWKNCEVQMVLSLRQGNSVVVDHLNPDVETRKRYVLVARRAKIPIRCFLMDVSYKHARHNIEFRKMTHWSHSSMTDMIFNLYTSKFQEPTIAEGFTEIVKVNFVPDFDTYRYADLYRMYLLDK
uniref:FHA_2 domain-containing protein n=1 Tax=Anopheles epiroticus TaxID=199890 RepID=A0A182P7U8_9DIPT